MKLAVRRQDQRRRLVRSPNIPRVSVSPYTTRSSQVKGLAPSLRPSRTVALLDRFTWTDKHRLEAR